MQTFRRESCGNKLYLAVLKYYRELAIQKYPLSFGINETDTPEEKLSNFIHTFIRRFFGRRKNGIIRQTPCP